MKLEDFLADAKKTDVTERVKIPKKFLDDELSKGDKIPIDYPAVEAEIITSDEFDIPPNWIVGVTIDLYKLP